jgi:hypothetical protein
LRIEPGENGLFSPVLTNRILNAAKGENNFSYDEKNLLVQAGERGRKTIKSKKQA